MTRAEKAERKFYGNLYQSQKVPERRAFISGYEQCEKDLTLTWEDVLKISELLKDVRYEFRNAGSYDDIPWYTGDGKSEYEEVLKRFNEQRKK